MLHAYYASASSCFYFQGHRSSILRVVQISLHKGPAELPKEWKEGPDGPEELKLNKRQILKEYWARWGKWLKYQPLDHIRFVTIIPHSHMLRAVVN